MEPKVADAWHIPPTPLQLITHKSEPTVVVHLMYVLSPARHLRIVVTIDVTLALTDGCGVAEASISPKGMLPLRSRQAW